MTGVSVVIPCRNGATFLAQTIRSVLNQTAPPREIIVVDDGSTDDSAGIARSFGAPVSVLTGEMAGAAAARRRGAVAARGERLMFLDADDLLTPATLDALGQALDGGPEAAVALCPWDRYEREDAAWIARPPSARLPFPGHDPLAAWLAGSWSPPCAVLWTRAGYEMSGGWDADLVVDQDGTLMRRAMSRGVAVRRTDHGLALYRRLPDGGLSVSGRRQTPEGLRSRLAGLLDTRDVLLQAGRLPRYRAPLAAAFHDLAGDAAECSDVARAAREAARKIRGRPVPRRRGSEVEARVAARISEWRRPAAEERPGVSMPDREPVPPIARGSLVSVIVPTFNRREAVARAVRSVLHQSYGDLELLVIDDGSTDGTAERLAGFSDPRLRVISQANGGVARARNRGLAEARGDFIAFLDSDDAWHPEKLGHQVAALEAAPRRFGFCHTAVELWLDEALVEVRRACACGDAFGPLLLTNTVHAPTTCGVIRREVYDAVGGFDPRLPAIEDWEWLLRVARLYHFLPVDLPLCSYDMAEDPVAPRRSRRFRANMAAREMLWQRNAHALRRAGAAHLFLIESARRELREPEGDPRKGRRLVLRALAERPQHRAHWSWVPYMATPFAVREWLRRIDAPRHERRVRSERAG